MEIERLIYIFSKKDDSLVKELNADALTLQVISRLFTHMDDDPDFYRPYEIKELQYNELMNYITELKNYSIKEFYLFLECVTI